MCRRLAPLLLVASAQALAPPPQLRLLTCDLDDTFWPTAEVVAAANAALYEALEARGAASSLLGETMKRLRRAAGVQMSYTEARTSAISELLGGEPGAEELFQLWLDARQRASEDLLFPDAATSLAEVRRRHPDAVVGAVTNGRGDPRQIPSLAPFFDFCVSGEDADVHPQRKPAPRIYEAALERSKRGPDGWVHLGDDVLNDCNAAKACGARTVWLDAAAPSWQENEYSTMSAADREKRRLAAEAVDVAVAVDRTIGALAALPDAVDGALS
jgi:HAD superfamily hydrolase (TIGR01509 family)